MRKYLFTLLLIFIYLVSFGQEKSKFLKVKINMIGHDHSELAKLGVECDHGDIALHKHIINVYSEEELKQIEEAGFEYSILIDDVEQFYNQYGTDDHRILNVAARQESCETTGRSYDFVTPENYEYGSMGGYLTYDEALVELDKMHTLYPELVTERMTIGDIVTHEGRNLFYMVISNNPTNITDDKPQIYYTALHHAREPNSLSQLIFYMWYLLENYDSNEEVKYLVDNTVMFFQPIVNPDGYVFNEITNPQGGGLWRKNRYPNENGEIVGVDLNRNYGYQWAFDNQGSSPNEESQVYRGPSAFSEPETQATRKLCMDNNFQIILNYHTFGNLLIHPWGFSDQPTEEDHIFKSIGRAMIEENSFLMGTGSETVGYVVNGDSDDYMYGEQAEKNKSYTLTPEVGPSFWPGEDQIDYLNKSAARLNLNAAHTLLSFANAKEVNVIPEFSAREGVLMFEVEKTGLQDGLIDFSVVSETTGFSLAANEFTALDMTIGERMIFEIPYQIDETFTAGDVEIVTQVDNGTYVHKRSIFKYFDENAPVPNEIFADPISSLENYTITGDWGITNQNFVSAPSSITDSPEGVYRNNLDSEIIIANSFDLSQAEAANLKFHTRFIIENDFDYVQLQVSVDGVNYVPMCGQYTNPGAEAQVPNAEPVYDNTQSDWALETICLDQFIGNDAVTIKFIFHSDNFLGADGFYFDNLILETFNSGVVSVKEVPLDVISIAPNPSQDYIQLTMDPAYFKENMSFQLFDMLGREVLNGAVDHPYKRLEISSLEAGTYVFRINLDNKLFSSGKVVKQ